MTPDCASLHRGYAPFLLPRPAFAGESLREPPPLPLHVLLLRHRRGLIALGAGDADLIAIGDAIGGCYDDAVVRRDAGSQFNILAEVPGDGHGLEHHLVFRTDGPNPQPLLLENHPP